MVEVKKGCIISVGQEDSDIFVINNVFFGFELYNWNGLLGVYPNIMGVKIGNTDNAGVTTIAISERGGKKLISVILGAPGVLERDLWAAKLLDIGFEHTAHLPQISITETELRAKYASWKYF